MNPMAIIEQATADGVNLALSETGTIKATGNQAAVNRWLPVIREHKPGVLAALTKISEELRRLVPAVVRAYGGPPEEEAEALAVALADPVAALRSFRLLAEELETSRPSCADCRHRSTLSNGAMPGHCRGRADLPPAYSEGHPLRLLPADGGAGCAAFQGWNNRGADSPEAVWRTLKGLPPS